VDFLPVLEVEGRPRFGVGIRRTVLKEQLDILNARASNGSHRPGCGRRGGPVRAGQASLKA